MALDEVAFGTNWVPEAEHGGFYQALVDGTYEKYGLKVTIVPGGPQAVGRALLLSDKVQFYMSGNMLGPLGAVEQGIPVVQVAATFQKDPQVFMAHPGEGVETFADLGKLPTLFVGKEGVASFFQWMKAAFPGFRDEQIKPYTFNPAPFIADKKSGQQGYVTSEPYEVERQGGFKPKVFLLADNGWETPSTMIEAKKAYVDKNPDVVQRFVEASMIGWYNYLYGDNKAANAMIKKENPDMKDEQIAFTIAKLKEYGLVDSGIATTKGIGCFDDARMKSFYDKMVAAKVVKAGLDIGQLYTNKFVCRGAGMNLRK
jgi:NitT/TauT family transport system substrate-binding protein